MRYRVEDASDAQLRTPLTVVVDRLKLPAKRKRLVEALEQGMFQATTTLMYASKATNFAVFF